MNGDGELEAAVLAVVFLPLVVVWLLALRDVLTRRDISVSRRVLTAVLLAVFLPLTVLYLLGRPPSSVRRAQQDTDDPRSELLDVLAGAPDAPPAAPVEAWVHEALAGQTTSGE